MAGLLGIGGGAIAVPVAQVVCRLPLRQCIGASAAVMCLTAGVGAALKLGTLSDVTTETGALADWKIAAAIVACLAPMALLGGFIGAGLTHRLPLREIRIVFSVVLLVVAARLSGLLH